MFVCSLYLNDNSNAENMNNKDWLSKNHHAIYDQAVQTMDYLLASGNIARMGLGGIQTWIDASLRPAFNACVEAFVQWENPAERTSSKMASLKTAEKNFTVLYRRLYTGILKNNPLVSNADLTSMGFPERGGDRRRTSKPKTSPACSVHLPGPGLVEFRYRNGSLTNPSRAKPYGVHGAEIAWAILDARAVDWSQLTHSIFSTASPVRLSFSGEQRGQSLYFAMRWENTRGEKGPWNEIQGVLIP